MPVDLGYFIIRNPRVSPINAATTVPPAAQGTYALKTAFSIQYVGTASTAVLTLTGTNVLTLINSDPTHADNLKIATAGLSISDLVDKINSNPNYSAAALTTSPSDFCFFKSVFSQNIKGSSYSAQYNSEKEYLIDVTTSGDIGASAISWKQGNFSYNSQGKKWIIDAGYIYDEKDEPVQLSGVGYVYDLYWTGTPAPIQCNLGVAPVGNDGAYLKFYGTSNSSDLDLSNQVSFNNEVLINSATTPTSQVPFPAAPILVPGTLQLKINGDVKTENVDYLVGYGTHPQITARNASPYTFAPSTNILKVRCDYDEVQSFTLPEGIHTARELADLINQTAQNFTASVYIDSDTHLSYFSVTANRGTYYHQIAIEDGSANVALGYVDFTANQGQGNGTLQFTVPVEQEVVPITSVTNQVQISAVLLGADFLGIDTNTFELYENAEKKTQNVDYLVNNKGIVSFINHQVDEPLTGGVLKADNSLFPASYVIYDNGTPLIEGVDYSVNLTGGWITLKTSAFPGHVYTADYISGSLGKITGEVLIGGPAQLTASIKDTYTINSNQNELKVLVSGHEVQTFTLPVNSDLTIHELVYAVNQTASGFVAINASGYFILKTLDSGPKASISIPACTASSSVGFSLNQSANGTGAQGGEQALSVQNAPMKVKGFTAPSGGNVLIFKNNDIISRYPPGAIVNMQSDYYQVFDSALDTTPNVSGSFVGPYFFISGSNDTLIFSLDERPFVTVVFAAGKTTAGSVVNQINSIAPNSAEVSDINGVVTIKIKGTTSVRIGSGSANRTLGFDSGSYDTNTPDSVIVTSSSFASTYVNPTLYTSGAPIPLVKEETQKKKCPQNSNTLQFLDDVTTHYTPNTLVQLDNKNFYRVIASTYDGSITTVTFSSKFAYPIYEDTSVSYTSHAIFFEGDNVLQTEYAPLTSELYTLKNNGVPISNTQYSLATSGKLTLKYPLQNGDNYTLSYIGKRIKKPGNLVSVNYIYVSPLSLGSKVEISLEAYNPDTFYLNVVHASTFMSSFQEVLTDKIKRISNSSSSGFPSGATPPSPSNSTSGSDSYPYTYGDIQNQIDLCLKWYDFFDQRIRYFEKEREILNGYVVGAESGPVSHTDISNAANLPPTRLFPYPTEAGVKDPRPTAQQSMPYNIPALQGLNQNDSGNTTGSSTAASYVTQSLSQELASVQSELSKLNLLRTFSDAGGYIETTGSFVLPDPETLSLYIETIGPGDTLYQNTVNVAFTAGIKTAAIVASAINSSCSFLGISPASVSGLKVRLTSAVGSGKAQCIYVLSDAPSIGFGEASETAIRSRRTLWTSGCPGVPLVASCIQTDINSETSKISATVSLLQQQIVQLEGEMKEWIEPFDTAYNLSKTEISSAQSFISDSSSFSASGSYLLGLRTTPGYIFTVMSEATGLIQDRIDQLNSRITAINSKLSSVSGRVNTVSTILTNENLYSSRYSWLTLLAHREYGFYTTLYQTLNQQIKKLMQSSSSNDLLNSMSTFG